MKERPILFNAAMVRAILEGRKTQTRRVIKPQPDVTEQRLKELGAWSADLTLSEHVNSAWQHGFIGEKCPFGDIGDHLWVRETFAALDPGSNEQAKPMENYGQVIRYSASQSDYVDPDVSGYRWMPSIHMPRWASRIQLEITDIRIQRLLDISSKDAIAEGFTGEDAFYRFIDTWQDIYGEEGIDQNVWVWVIEFKRVPNRDF